MQQTPFRFPPTETGSWRSLSTSLRKQWLNQAWDAVHSRPDAFTNPGGPKRELHIDGRLIDDLQGFYCFVGEAVNGPGGYFGRSLDGFDDCLFGGFGLDSPWTIIWRHAAMSRRILDSVQLLALLDEEYSHELDPDLFAEGLKWRAETRKAAAAGQRSLFDEIVDIIVSAPSRGNIEGELRLYE